ncbi:MAG: Stp1/IreP family PP2C-type Ser/Thr phosphatase [Actinomycetota bacterium]|nr:Stp1/IreP family PP2C-type Ser/Thr phosphatase [Actinomycetota bacterium]
MREGNEDSYLVDAPLFVVADGMGGHVAGDVASATAVEVLDRRSRSLDPKDPATLEQAIKEANIAIFQKARSDPSLRGMGTTCTLLIIDGANAQFAHVGDSRAYLLRQGQLSQVTEDHTLVSRMVAEGRIDEEEARHHPQRSVITRALGVDTDVQVDLTTLQLRDGDRVLLCSDGLTTMLGNPEVSSILSNERDPQTAAEHLIAAANEAGGEDNITAIVVDVDEGDAERSATASSAAPVPSRTRQDTDPAAAPRQPSNRLKRAIVVTSLALLVLGAIVYLSARFFLDRSWFVGVNASGYVAIFKGIPDEIAGLTLRSEEQTTTVSASDLCGSVKSNVEEGIKVDSLQAAREAVTNIEGRAKACSPEPQPSPPKHRKKGR